MIEKAKRGFWYIVGGLFPVWYSKRLFRNAFSRELDLRHPESFDEKLQWLKLNTYRSNPLVRRCADKYAVRQYVEECSCGEILNELHGVWKRSADIDWEQLPEQFVLKCNHASGFNWICRSKKDLDIGACRRQLNKWMRRDFWRFSAEMQYRGIPKCIVCEKMLGEAGELYDYKIYCFHGKPCYIMTCVGRAEHELKFYFFDSEWKLCRINPDSKEAPEDFTLPRPEHLDDMLSYAERLAEPFPFVRVDLYDEAGKVIFGELTFTPAAALDVARLPEADRLFGSLLTI